MSAYPLERTQLNTMYKRTPPVLPWPREIVVLPPGGTLGKNHHKQNKQRPFSYRLYPEACQKRFKRKQLLPPARSSSLLMLERHTLLTSSVSHALPSRFPLVFLALHMPSLPGYPLLSTFLSLCLSINIYLICLHRIGPIWGGEWCAIHRSIGLSIDLYIYRGWGALCYPSINQSFWAGEMVCYPLIHPSLQTSTS